ncbi:hypothetical protein NMY22_g12395 [Coprinellus aureogranulatus]|nr:hypothetical protein NMY22_g12395 [Coprinellus aureogranulatus]
MEKIKPLGQSRSWDSVTNLRLTVESEWCEEEDNDHQGANPSIRMFTQFPSALRSLYLHLPPSKQVGTDVSLDLPAGFCAQLRELTLVCDWEADKVLSALKLCTDLETFALDADYVRFDFEADNPWQARTEEQTTLLTTVRRLSLLNIHPEASAFLDFFRPYALEELSLDFTSGLDWLGCRGVPSLLDYFEPFIRRSEEKGTFHLRRLRLTGIEIDAEDMLSILLNLPSLTHLALNTVWVPSTLFRDLLEIETVVPLPHLRELTLRDLPHEFLVWDVRVYVEGRQTLMMEDGNRLAQTTLSIDGTLHAVNGCLVPFFETQRTESDEWDSDEEESDEEEGELENKGNHGERLMSVDEDEGGMA